MEKKSINNYKLQFSIIGFLLGLILIAVIYASALSSNGIVFTFKNILKLHTEGFYFYIIDSIPFIITLTSYIVGYYTYFIASNLAKLENEKEQSSSAMLEFAENLSKGSLETDYSPEKTNTMGKILTNLRNSLKQNKTEDRQRKQEDEQRNWIAEGLAKFGEILRHNNDNIEVLSYELVSNLCRYIDAVQGGFFIINNEYEDDKYFELLAHFAYDRKKYNKKRLELSEGLIGRSVFEKNIIYIDEVPDDYVDITSGLGEANPKVLLIVPLIANEIVIGVIEMTAFGYFESHKIEFVEKVAESIATTYSTVKTNLRTANLLNESQQAAERLTQQEEEMRQNMEELQATQEEASKQAKEFISFTNSVNHTLIRAEYDINGILLYANTKFLKKLGYSSNSEVEGHHISIFISDKDKSWFNEIWDELAKGGKHFEGYMKHVTKTGKDLWTMATYTCVRNNLMGVEKILFLAIDTTEQKEQSLDLEGQIGAIDQSSLKVEYAPSGRMLVCNQKFIDTLGYSTEDLKDYSVFSFMGENEQSDFEDIWDKVINGEPYQGQSKQVTSKGKSKWFDVTYTAARNMYGEVSKIISIAHDITEQKEMEILTQQQNELLKKQEEELKASEVDLQNKLDKAKKEVKQQFQEIEKVKIRNEKTLEGAHDAIISINQEGIVDFFNRSAENLWGYSRKEVIGKNVKMLFKKVKDEKEDEMIFTLTHPEKRKLIGIRKESFIVTKDGEEKSILLMLAGAKVQNEYTYTAFIQNIEVELF
ncbi:MAG: PAS domain S-box protein [Salinivirgaceae bacterium]|jgi:PAS domain S-box-containing protein|nr:PAS domain S-box protein [Salinivirgaceae bacterium]